MQNQLPREPKQYAAEPSSIVEVLRAIDEADAKAASLVLELPLPPSVNRTSGTRRGNTHPLVTAWRRWANAHLIMTKQNKNLKLIEGTIFVDIIWDLPKLADIDNRFKHLFDYLQWIGVVTNDNKIKGMHVGEGVVAAGCRVRLQSMHD